MKRRIPAALDHQCFDITLASTKTPLSIDDESMKDFDELHINATLISRHFSQRLLVFSPSSSSHAARRKNIS